MPVRAGSSSLAAPLGPPFRISWSYDDSIPYCVRGSGFRISDNPQTLTPNPRSRVSAGSLRAGARIGYQL